MLVAYYQNDTGDILTHRHLSDGSPLFSGHCTCNMSAQEKSDEKGVARFEPGNGI